MLSGGKQLYTWPVNWAVGGVASLSTEKILRVAGPWNKVTEASELDGFGLRSSGFSSPCAVVTRRAKTCNQ